MDIAFVEKADVTVFAVITREEQDIIALDDLRLLVNGHVLPCNLGREERFPFMICKPIVVEQFELLAEVGDKVSFSRYRLIE